MANKLRFDDHLCTRSMKVQSLTCQIAEYIISDITMTFNKASKEFMIPRRTMMRYLFEYPRKFVTSYDSNNNVIDWDEYLYALHYRLKQNKRKYCGQYW